jgi:hypothetical protein
MAIKRLLVQTQLSNYDTNGKFILECDSGWQMVVGRCREMLRLNPDLQIDVMGPKLFDSYRENASQVITYPDDINPDLDWKYLYSYVDPEKEQRGRLNYIQHEIIPNALATRYDFNFDLLPKLIGLQNHKAHPQFKYDAVYINDPMHLRNFKAMFMLKAGYRPNFYVHSHFIDIPECPKFPTEASLWLGQCEASLKADYNFWQCESSMNEFMTSMSKWFTQDVVDDVRAKSAPWDDGYSRAEITSPVNEKNMRFTPEEFRAKTAGKNIIFVPNRIGGKGRSSDYTNCGKFMFELLPQLRQRRQDFVVICGNPSQKFLNSELEEWHGKDGYISLVPDAFNRDEFKFIASQADIALGLYDQDAYGGTAARECVELGCMPLWLDCNEYSRLAREAGAEAFVLAKMDFSDLGDKLFRLLDLQVGKGDMHPSVFDNVLCHLQETIQRRCSYEATTEKAMARMGLLPG